MKIRIVLLVVCLLVAGLPAAGHHSVVGAFDINKTVSVTGVVTKILWMNPHVVVLIKSTNESGKTETWAFQGMAPSNLNRFNNRDKFKEGMAVSATGHPARSTQRGAGSPAITSADAVTMNVETLELRLSNGEVLAFSRMNPQSPKP
jgi:DNA/RNA endonuclease YhcR with UshA esterase domain